MSSTTNSLDAFKSVFGEISEPPYCSGTATLDASTATLFYNTENKTELLNFAHASEDQLTSLAAACQQATFGVDQKDVLDESYRKAGKLDATQFATQFSPFPGIIDTVRESLLHGEHSEKSIKAEIYKLNVYGLGSFFKSHVDTPRSDTMFGSLVVVLPITHEGGSLICRHRGEECEFDTAKAVMSENSPQVAFVAFFSDVEHEVSKVISGYRVTLTYNLYFVDRSAAPKAPLAVPSDPVNKLKPALLKLLASPTFLPNGGLLGFYLSHKYPFNPATTSLASLEKHLKGNDASIRRICKALSLDVSLKAIYPSDNEECDGSCLLDSFADLGGFQIENGVTEYLRSEEAATIVYDSLGEDLNKEDAVPIVWLKPQGVTNSFRQPYVRYGNEATLDYTYGEVCLVTEIGPPEDRIVA
ncbi:hypothetical protein GALMADRAFT_119596 [Galerina marginata CBS 339.88]|uniref:Prolyl 4-hydroxylase alpha subunit Fe(2+) 2OG dioxygenase domain-containing protein n=1 Tax=Galerina marginata (strain CBS 339.88) TaxID=685588 RepID=A0A067TC73_GALM3|nr:hypothetical protein GALMADRAFT_119596 [Galerina marginata CBS 339.88]